MCYDRKNVTFYEENSKFTKKNTFNNFVCNKIFSYYRFIFLIIGFS